MKLQEICEKMHIDEIGKPGTIIKWIYNTSSEDPRDYFKVAETINNKWIRIEGYCTYGVAKNFKKANL